MAQELNLKIAGLYTLPNNFSGVPEGALEVANNIVIDDDGIAASRRGFKRYPDADNPAPGTDQILNYTDKLLVHGNSTLSVEDGGTWDDFNESIDSPDASIKIRSLELNGNLYLTSDMGVKRLDGSDPSVNSIVDAGTPRALDVEAELDGTAGFLPDNTAVAYRLIWVFKDANNNRIAGAPSERTTVANASGGTRNVQIVTTIPDDITTDYTFELYRSAPSASSSTVPDDELQLVQQGSPSSSDITNKSMTFIDDTSNFLRGADLYTNPSQQGISQANITPPFARDMTQFKDITLFVDTQRKHRLQIDLLSVGTSGVQTGDTITIAGTTYTGAATEDVANDEFLVDTSGSASANIENTAKSLIRVINRTATQSDVYAYYVSGFDEFPGQILLEERNIGGSAFSITAGSVGTGDSFAPSLPTSGTSVSSDNEREPNRIYFSKVRQPDSVPLVNWVSAGRSTFPVKRIVSLREAVFIFKDDGIFRMTQSGGSFRVESFDPTIRLFAPESVVAHTNRIFCFTNQAVVAVDDTGTSIMSRPIERTLLQLAQLSNFSDNTFGISYESDRKYILFTISGSSDTRPTQAFVYNSLTRSWTRWPISATSGITNFNDDRLYLAGGEDSFVRQERKTFDTTDFADDEFDVLVTNQIDLNTITVDDASDLAVDMTIIQGAREAVITEIDGNDLTLDTQFTSWETAGGSNDATVYTPINVTLKYSPMFGETPSILKHFEEATLFFENVQFESVDVRFSSNFVSDNTAMVTSLTVTPSGGWGSFPWGSLPWGSGQGDGQEALRTFIPRESRRANWLNVSVVNNQAFTSFSFKGVSIQYDYTSTRIK